MPKGSAPRKTVSTTRKLPDGSQQYVRGSDEGARVSTAGKAVRSTKNIKAQRMLLRAQEEEMSPYARNMGRPAAPASTARRVDKPQGKSKNILTLSRELDAAAGVRRATKAKAKDIASTPRTKGKMMRAPVGKGGR